MNFLLDIPKESYGDKILLEYGFAETLAFGAKILLIGVVAVFGVLCLIWAALALFNRFFSNHKPAQKSAQAPVPVAAPAPVRRASTDEEIVAVIAAAIAMAESEGSGAKYRVVSFKRK